MFVYLAHPIDQVSDTTPLKRMLHSVSTAMAQQAVSAFRPGRAYSLGMLYGQTEAGKVAATPDAAHLHKIDTINRMAIWEADAVVAVLPPGVPTLGTPAEIQYALDLNRPVLIVTTADMVVNSVQIWAWLNRGCKLALVDSVMGQFIERYDIKALLADLPDPTLNVQPTEQAASPPPGLMVSGATENLVPGKYEGDAGLDLAISVDAMVQATEYKMIPTGVHVAIPPGYFGLITGRSSTWAKHRCRIVQAVIDSGYRGELMVGVLNEGQPIKFEAGTRLAQMILLPTYQGGMTRVDKLPDHERGLAGYGSSGS